MRSIAPLSPELRAAFASRLREHAGLAFSSGHARALDSAVVAATQAAGLDAPTALLDALGMGDARCFAHLVEAATVGETYFLRHPAHFAFLRRCLAARRDQRTALWSAACSTGEEAYTMAICALEVLGLEARQRVTIRASDIDRAAIAHARVGHYSAWSFRDVPPSFRERWFIPDGRGWTIALPLRGWIQFDVANLLDRPPSGVADFIFCRNALLYMDSTSMSRILTHLTDALAERGWLVVGPSDPVLFVPGLVRRPEPETLAYHKAGPEDAPRRVTSHDPPAPPPPAPAQERKPAGPARPERTTDWPSAPTIASAPSAPSQGWDYNGALSNSARASLLNKARRLADVGDTAGAITLLDTVLAADPFLPGGFGLRATLKHEAGDAQGMAMDARRALLLDRSDVMAHVLLALAEAHLGRRRESMRSVRNAMHLALSLPPDAVVPGFDFKVPVLHAYLRELRARLVRGAARDTR